MRRGYRGYMGARMALGRSVPQSVQQLVMRDYCERRGMTYLLAATEHLMPGCAVVLDAVLAELDTLEGIVVYSLAVLPRRRAIFDRVLAAGATLHAAVEGVVIVGAADVARVEDVWSVLDVVDAQPADLFATLARLDA